MQAGGFLVLAEWKYVGHIYHQGSGGDEIQGNKQGGNLGCGSR
jgi:hypothetical protein